MSPKVGTILPLHSGNKVAGIGIGIDEISATRQVGKPTVRDQPSPAKLDASILHMPITTVRLFYRLKQAWIGHSVEHMPHRLRMIFVQDINDLLIQLLQLIVGATSAF
jgi:hypothetical protein